jgi:transposase
MADLYRIEAAVVDLDPDDRRRYRLLHAKPQLDDFHRWLVALRATTLGGSGLAKAIDYSLKRWSALTRYLDDGKRPAKSS